jgi:tetratricopeptide (TPR) repeat protein
MRELVTVNKPVKKNPNIAAKRMASAKLLKQAKRELAKENWMTSLAYFNELWDRDPNTNEYLIVIAHIMSRANMRKQAIQFAERALKACGPTNEVLMIVGELAHKMGLFELMAKIFNIYIELFPDEPTGYENLALAMYRLDKHDDAITVLQDIIPLMPEQPKLWNLLALVVSGSTSEMDALVFVDEAIRLNPDRLIFYDTKAFCYFDMGDYDTAFSYWKKAYEMKSGEKSKTLEFSMSIHYLGIGEFERGFEWYEHRQHPASSIRVNWSLETPHWDGEESLEGKSIFLKNEQGIGDEMCFASLYNFVIEEAEQVYIGCDRRLVELFESSFPKAIVVSSVTTTYFGHIVRGYPDVEFDVEAGKMDFDLALPIGTLPKIFLQKRYDDIKKQNGFLKASPKKLRKWRTRVNKIGKKNLRVGVCWRSLLKSTDRVRHYTDIVDWGDILQTPNVDFYNLQCGDSEEEVAVAEEKLGIKIHQFADLNLKDDIADIAALMSCMDLVVGPASAAMHLASSVGRPTIWMHRAPFAFFYGEDGFALYTDTRNVFTRFGLPNEQHLSETHAEFSKFSKEWSCPR